MKNKESTDLRVTEMVSLADLGKLVEQSHRVHQAVRAEMLKPHPRKVAPRYSLTAIAEILGVERGSLETKLRAKDFPRGEVAEGKRKRTYSLEESRSIIQKLGNYAERAPGTNAVVMSIVNFKGGSTKTSTVFNLAQGLALRGRKVLLVDLDPQGSASVLAGLMPATELEEADTASMLVAADGTALTNLDYAITPTYWAGLDLVPGAPPLNSAELILPIIATRGLGEWWRILDNALEKHRSDYDYILIDTAPSLSYLAILAICASDGLLMPLPPEQLDFSASIAFWSNIVETLQQLQAQKGFDKEFKFVNVLLSRVKATQISSMMKMFVSQAYSPYVMTTEILASDANAIGGAVFGTAHDIMDNDGVARSDFKLRRAFDTLVDAIDQQAVALGWGR
jgi:chromosome partitioning protein